MAVRYVHSLEHVTCVKIVISLFQDCEIKDLISALKFSAPAKHFSKIEEKATEKISNIVNVPKLQRLVMSYIMPMVYDILKWKKEHSLILSKQTLCFALNNALLWKPEGKIDREKTANYLLKCNELVVCDHFVLACTYGLFENAHKLWNGMSEFEKDIFLKTKASRTTIVKVWIDFLRSTASKTWESFQAWVLKTSYRDYNLYMLRHIMENSTSERRLHYSSCVLESTSDEEMIRYCVLQMNSYEREILFQKFPSRILGCFFEWSSQETFLDLAQHLLSYFSKVNFYLLFYSILCKMANRECQKKWCIELVKEFWSLTPTHCKNYMQNKDIFGVLKCVLNHNYTRPLPAEKMENVELLHYADLKFL